MIANRSFHVMALMALVGFGAASARATSQRIGAGTSGPGSPPCSEIEFSADASGAIPAGTDCEEGANATTISVFLPGTTPFVLYSPLLESPTLDAGSIIDAIDDPILAAFGSQLEWTQTCGVTPAGDYQCTLTAPTPSGAASAFLATLSKVGLINDGDCDSDDDILFVPKNCDVFFTTGAIGNLSGDTSAAGDLLTPGETVESTSNNAPFVPFPEPSSLALAAAGLAGLSVFRRKLAR